MAFWAVNEATVSLTSATEIPKKKKGKRKNKNQRLDIRDGYYKANQELI